MPVWLEILLAVAAALIIIAALRGRV